MATHATLGSPRGFLIYDTKADALAGALAQLAELGRGIDTSNLMLGIPNRNATSVPSCTGIYRSEFRPTTITPANWRKTLWNGSWDTVSWAPRI